MGEAKFISKIVYTSRNRDNYIRPEDELELFSCQKYWRSLGIQTPKSDSLLYKDVPRDALLLLVNHLHGVQERIFTYEKGKQI